jgi:hypothetical protein
VVTNHHVVADEQSITVTAFDRDGDRFEKKVYKKVKLVALDEHMDLALLHIEEDIGIDIPQIYIGDSTQMKVGDKVFTIGNPMGLERSTSEGIASKVSRNMDGRLYIQITAPISPGSSGGPLFNERGEVIGVTNMGYIFLDGLAFAIPSKYVKEFLDNVEAFAYDPDNPNSGVKYMEAPVTASDGSLKFTAAEFIKAGQGVTCLTLADMDADGVEEALFVDNNKGSIGVLRRRRADEVEEQAADFEDINRIPDSERFKLVTHAVKNHISSMVVADMNGDQRPDIVFHGDIDDLAVLDQKADGTFADARRMADVDVCARRDALRVVDLDGDGTSEVFALGPTGFTVIRKDGDREEFPLNTDYRDAIQEFHLRDVNLDGRLDITFFCAGESYAAYVLLQNERGEFAEEEWVPSHLSGPIKPYSNGADRMRFLTLDKAKNRARELVLGMQPQPAVKGRLNTAVQAVAVDPGKTMGEDVEIADLNGDGRQEIVTASKSRNEFVILEGTKAGFVVNRSPAPRNVSGLRLLTLDQGRSALFCFSVEDKLFGVSRIQVGGVTFPRPINVDGIVQFMWLGKVDGETLLLWVEKADSNYVMRTVPAAAVAAKAYDTNKGSIDVDARNVLFGEEGNDYSAKLPRKPDRIAFADFNADGKADLVVYWSYSGKESLYLGEGGGKFTPVIVDQEFLDEQKDQPLIVADIDGDGADDVLSVQPGFVRVLKVDDKNKLYVERQFNWEFGAVSKLVPHSVAQAPRFVALTGREASIVEFDVEGAAFTFIASLDMTGLGAGDLRVADVDGEGTPDLVLPGSNAVRVIYGRDVRRTLDSRIVFDAKLDYFQYWNIHPADLDGDGKDEVLLFDSKKAMFEIHRPGPGGVLKPVCRQRLFEKNIYQRSSTDSYEMPRELAVGDVDGNGKADLIFVLQDRVAIYLQDAGT